MESKIYLPKLYNLLILSPVSARFYPVKYDLSNYGLIALRKPLCKPSSYKHLAAK